MPRSRPHRQPQQRCLQPSSDDGPNRNGHGATGESSQQQQQPRHQPQHGGASRNRIQAGNIGTFLFEDVIRSKQLSKECLIGPLPTAERKRQVYSNLQTVTSFLRHHQTLKEAAASAAAAATSATPPPGQQESTTDSASSAVPNALQQLVQAPEYYMPTLQEFESRQLDRQAAGLRTNTNRASSEDLNRLIENHKHALLQALDLCKNRHPSPIPNRIFHLSNRKLGDINGKLCCNASPPSRSTGTSTAPPAASTATVATNNNVTTITSTATSSSSSYRSHMARASNTVFCPPNQIHSEMEKFLTAMEDLGKTWLEIEETQSSSSDRSQQQKQQEQLPIQDYKERNVYDSISLAAMWLYGICDIHPYCDGNGRLSRIMCNYALKRLLNLPFTITLAATLPQRRQYVDGLRHGHQQLLSARTRIPTISLSHVSSSSTDGDGIFERLLEMLLERLVSAIHQFQSALEQKSNARQAEAEARIARQVRERAAGGQCVICLDSNPNIATLCCGQAVHLNCIAEWLSNQQTCVACRNPLPFNQRTRAAHRPSQDYVDAADNPLDLFFRNMFQVQQMGAVARGAMMDSNGGNALDDTTTIELERMEEQVSQCLHCHNRAATDCENYMCGRCCDQFGMHHCNRHRTNPTNISMSDRHNEDTTMSAHSEDVEDEDTAVFAAPQRNDFEDTASFAQEEDDTTTFGRPPLRQPECCSCRNPAASDCGNAMCARCCPLHGRNDCPRHGVDYAAVNFGNNEDTTSMDDDGMQQEDEDTTTHQYQQQSIAYCLNCQNRAASDCPNENCGRCCVLYGQFHCARHSPYW